ncbi:MAG: sulfite exporter TauE/SafE family protein [Syntrophobacteraceae bacterium]
MDFLSFRFPVSGVETSILIPPLVAFFVSVFTSMAGVSGAFLLLPFQMSFLGFTTPSVSATNFVYNIVAIPSGVYRYLREGRMAWPLTIVVIVGTLPGVFLGYYLRVLYMPDPRAFKLFVGLVLLYIGLRLLYEMTPRSQTGKKAMKALEEKFNSRITKMKAAQSSRISSGLPAEAVIKTISVSVKRVEYDFWGQRFSFSTPGMFILALAVGVIGGIYGIGGGAIIAPFCVAVFHLPVYTVAGAALMGTFITSIAGVFFYSMIPPIGGLTTAPDWLLGSLFGFGGFFGMYIGARLQKFVPQKFIKLLLGIFISYVAIRYVSQYFG